MAMKMEKISLSNIKDIIPFLNKKQSNSCDYTLGVKYMWRDYYQTEYAIINQTLVMGEYYNKGPYAFYYPIGEDVEQALKEIEIYSINRSTPLVFGGLSLEECQKIHLRYPHARFFLDRNSCDYLYDGEKMKNLSGKSLSGKRNHLNHFNHQYEKSQFIKADELLDYSLFQAFMDEYNSDMDSNEEAKKQEISLSMDLLLHFRELGMNLGYLVFDGEIIGYALGEVKREVLYIHQEKGLKRFGGVYQKLVSEFAKAFLAEATIINREDDNGDLGLRTSKIQYNPSSLVEKYALYVENPLDLCSSIPQLLVDQYTLMGLREKDKEVYYELALDKELNQYWGYDIEKDLIHPTPQYVYEMMEHDLEKKEAFSWIIYQGDILIGEVVCYHLKCDSSCEIGTRIKKEYQGKGIATKAVQLISHYLLKTLKLKTINAKCFKENQASRKVLIKDGYQENGEDDTYFFFQKEEKK